MPDLTIPLPHALDRPRSMPDRSGRALLVLVLLAIAITAVRYYLKAEKPSRTGEQTRTAFLRWRPQIQALQTKTNIYTAFNYPNPPIMALVLAPFVALPPLVGALLWFAVKAAMALWFIRWALRSAGAGPPVGWTGLAVLLALHPILGDLSHGNVNIFIAFLVLGSLALYQCRLDFAAGLALALAIACKVTPALFLPYFVWKRSWRAVAGTFAGLALWLAVVPGLALGWDTNRELLASWFETMVKPFVVDGKVTSEHANQSIPGLAFRLLTAEPSFLEYDEDERPVASDYHNLASFAPARVQLLVKGLMGLFALAVLALCRWPAHRVGIPRAGPLLMAEFAIVLLGMLLFSERTWKHHATTLIVPFAVLAWAAGAAELSPRMRTVVKAALVLIGLLLVVPSLLPEQAQDLTLVYGAATGAYVLTTLAIFAVLARARKDSPLPAT
jgi:alpha-1,2-mannosyltransferase